MRIKYNNLAVVYISGLTIPRLKQSRNEVINKLDLDYK